MHIPGSGMWRVLGGETEEFGRRKSACRKCGRVRRLLWKDLAILAVIKVILSGGRWVRIDSTSSLVLSTRVAAETGGSMLGSWKLCSRRYSAGRERFCS